MLNIKFGCSECNRNHNDDDSCDVQMPRVSMQLMEHFSVSLHPSDDCACLPAARLSHYDVLASIPALTPFEELLHPATDKQTQAD